MDAVYKSCFLFWFFFRIQRLATKIPMKQWPVLQDLTTLQDHRMLSQTSAQLELSSCKE
ncbi:Hypothetical predicted protein [Pelobates cultripes]|uniref:Uncharacterized protein n=1 Tax=Pelobates cultripes TaxID=61616 RepID=A0AAD1SMF4_PELCU|nr:Hypothetical predicted protein [Pelobates cultripes]